MNLQGEKHVFFMGKTQLVPAGYVVNKNGLGGSVWVPNKIETPISNRSNLSSKNARKNQIPILGESG